MGLRAAQYAAASVVLGLPAFMLYGAGALGGRWPGWARPVLGWAPLRWSLRLWRPWPCRRE